MLNARRWMICMILAFSGLLVSASKATAEVRVYNPANGTELVAGYTLALDVWEKVGRECIQLAGLYTENGIFPYPPDPSRIHPPQNTRVKVIVTNSVSAESVVLDGINGRTLDRQVIHVCLAPESGDKATAKKVTANTTIRGTFFDLNNIPVREAMEANRPKVYAYRLSDMGRLSYATADAEGVYDLTIPVDRLDADNKAIVLVYERDRATVTFRGINGASGPQSIDVSMGATPTPPFRCERYSDR